MLTNSQETDKWRPRIKGHPWLGDVTNLIERGWYVFPVESHTKIPQRGFMWSELATNDAGIIIDNWVDEDNIGIACKQSGLLVLDFDTRHNADCVNAMLDLLDTDDPQTYRTMTASGGQHWYYRNHGDLGNSPGSLPYGIDVRGGRGDGGYVLGAGSYVITDDYSGPYTVIDNDDANELPEEIRRLLREPRRHKTPAEQRRGMRLMSPGHLRLYKKQLLQAIVDAPDGEQNSTINTSAFKAGMLVSEGMWDIEDAQEELSLAAYEGGHPQWRAASTIRSGLWSGIGSK
jgi:hypothetical protein